MIKFFYKHPKNRNIKTLNEFKSGAWVYVENPSESEIDFLEQKFGIEDGLLRDSLDIYEVPRLETERNVVYVFTRYAYEENSNVISAPLMIAIGKNFIITVSAIPFPYLEKLLNLKNGQSIITTERTKTLVQILSLINNQYNSFLQNINKRVRGMSVQLDKIQNKDIVQFVTFETILSDFLSAFVPKNTVLRNIVSGKTIKLNDEERDLMEDILLSNGQLIELAQANLRTIVNIREAYSTIMTHNLNRIIKLFTSLTVILTIPTMIASIYGMNVPLPFADSPVVFYEIITALILVSVVLILIFIRKRWL